MTFIYAAAIDLNLIGLTPVCDEIGMNVLR
jgi:hypothetical protein